MYNKHDIIMLFFMFIIMTYISSIICKNYKLNQENEKIKKMLRQLTESPLS
jgi:hypothetical protein